MRKRCRDGGGDGDAKVRTIHETTRNMALVRVISWIVFLLPSRISPGYILQQLQINVAVSTYAVRQT
jgi:hypothetical protein